MPLSSLLITLRDDGPEAAAALRELERHARIELGLRRGRRVAAVVDTPDAAEDQRLWAWLQELSGVAMVDVLFVYFDGGGKPSAEPQEQPASSGC
jgi:hypothetical protein